MSPAQVGGLVVPLPLIRQLKHTSKSAHQPKGLSSQPQSNCIRLHTCHQSKGVYVHVQLGSCTCKATTSCGPMQRIQPIQPLLGRQSILNMYPVYTQVSKWPSYALVPKTNLCATLPSCTLPSCTLSTQHILCIYMLTRCLCADTCVHRRSTTCTIERYKSNMTFHCVQTLTHNL